jgi:hypothetical protein
MSAGPRQPSRDGQTLAFGLTNASEWSAFGIERK